MEVEREVWPLIVSCFSILVTPRLDFGGLVEAGAFLSGSVEASLLPSHMSHSLESFLRTWHRSLSSLGCHIILHRLPLPLPLPQGMSLAAPHLSPHILLYGGHQLVGDVSMDMHVCIEHSLKSQLVVSHISQVGYSPRASICFSSSPRPSPCTSSRGVPHEALCETLPTFLNSKSFHVKITYQLHEKVAYRLREKHIFECFWSPSSSSLFQVECFWWHPHSFLLIICELPDVKVRF